MGATTSLLAAALEPNIRAVWADSPYADTYDVITEDAPSKGFSPIFCSGGMFWDGRSREIVFGKPPRSTVALYWQHTPSHLSIHADADTTVRFHHSVELFNTIKQQVLT